MSINNPIAYIFRYSVSTTRQYNLKYSSLTDETFKEEIRRRADQHYLGPLYELTSKEEREKLEKMAAHYFNTHPLFDMHAFGVIAETWFKKLSISNMFVAKNLHWLYIKCKEQDPDRRLTPEHAHYFLYLIRRYLKCK